MTTNKNFTTANKSSSPDVPTPREQPTTQQNAPGVPCTAPAQFHPSPLEQAVEVPSVPHPVELPPVIPIKARAPEAQPVAKSEPASLPPASIKPAKISSANRQRRPGKRMKKSRTHCKGSRIPVFKTHKTKVAGIGPVDGILFDSGNGETNLSAEIAIPAGLLLLPCATESESIDGSISTAVGMVPNLEFVIDKKRFHLKNVPVDKLGSCGILIGADTMIDYDVRLKTVGNEVVVDLTSKKRRPKGIKLADDPRPKTPAAIEKSDGTYGPAQDTLTDSGCDRTTVHVGLIPGVAIDKSKSISVEIANGKYTTTLGQARIRIRCQGGIYDAVVDVIDCGEVALYLGIDFFTRFQIIIRTLDWTKLEVIFPMKKRMTRRSSTVNPGRAANRNGRN